MRQAIRPEPVRTCVGCRRRAVKPELLRVVADGALVVADPLGRKGGRGAYVHPGRGCLAQAERRRAFVRALRVPGPLDLSPLRAYVERLDPEPEPESRSCPS